METNEIEIYNLEFPDNVEELNIGGYCFTRTFDYADRLKELANNGRLQETNHGCHQVTALMTLPEEQKAAVLPWEDPENDPKDPREYLDLLLILSLLTKRNVFAKTWSDTEGKRQIIEDPRHHRGNFNRFILPVGKNINNQTGEIIDNFNTNGLNTLEWIKLDKNNEDESELLETDQSGWIRFDQGLEIAANKAWNTIKDEVWQKKYNNGAFLLIFSQSQRRQRIESAFILSWSIWEHIFSLHHSPSMTREAIERTSGAKKYEFIKKEYFSDSRAEEESEIMIIIRNRLFHFGFFHEDIEFIEKVKELKEQKLSKLLQKKEVESNFKTIKNIDLKISKQLKPELTQSECISNFFRDTEQLVAKILKLAK